MHLQIDKHAGSFGYMIDHNDSKVFVPTRTFSRAAKTKTKNPWENLSGYIAASNQENVDKLFLLYIQTEGLADLESTDEIMSEAQQIIETLDSMFDYDSFDTYFDTSMITIPKEIEANQVIYSMDDMYKQRTYSPHDYRQLVLLALQLRLYSPIIGTVIDALTDAGKLQIEFNVWILFKNTTLWRLSALDRLDLFIEALTAGEKSPAVAHIESISSEMIPVQILAMILFRKLVHYDVEDPELNIVSHIYKYTETCYKALERSNGGPVNERKGLKNDGDKPKIDGRYDIRSKTTISDEVAYQVEVEDWDRLLCSMPEPLQKKGMKKEVKALAAYILEARDRSSGDFKISPFQFALAMYAWRSIDKVYLSSLGKEVARVIAAAQYVFIHTGFPNLAAILTGQEDVEHPNRPKAMAHLKTPTVMEMGKQYQFFSVQRVHNNRERPRSVLKSINLMVGEITQHALVNHLPAEYGLTDTYLNSYISDVRADLGDALKLINNLYAPMPEETPQ